VYFLVKYSYLLVRSTLVNTVITIIAIEAAITVI